jgi:hypothetical protein
MTDVPEACPECERYRETNRRLNRRCQTMETGVPAFEDTLRMVQKWDRSELLAIIIYNLHWRIWSLKHENRKLRAELEELRKEQP